MEVLVVADAHFYKTPDGKYWAKTIYGYHFWKRYLSVFDSVAVVSRTKRINKIDSNTYLRVDGPNLRVIELPFLRGMKQYIYSFSELKKTAKTAVEGVSTAIFRLPSVVADIVLDEYKKTGKPYAIEVVADPYDAYKSNKVAQKYYTNKLKRQTLNANGVSYVTQYYLQSKYPSKAGVEGETAVNFESYYSTIDLRKDFFWKSRDFENKDEQYTIVHTSNSINSENKGHRTVIRTIQQLRENNYDVEVIFIGDGSKRKTFEQISKKYGVEKYVKFTGLLSSTEEVRKILLQGDIFLFPTEAEGLPRAIIEAMAVGLPCLSTPVNGIPELLSDKYLFHPSDVDGFTEKIIELINNPAELNKMSEENISNAKKYTIDKLSTRRNEFYMKLKRISK